MTLPPSQAMQYPFLVNISDTNCYVESASEASQTVVQADLSPPTPIRAAMGDEDLSQSVASQAEHSTRLPSRELNVFALLPTSIRLYVQASSFSDVAEQVYAHSKRKVSDAIVYLTLDGHPQSVPVSVTGQGWSFVQEGVDVVVRWEEESAGPPTIDAVQVAHICWDLCSRHRTPLRETPSAVRDVLGYVGMSVDLSYRQARLNIIQELILRDMHFILSLRGRECCMLADSTPVDSNHELTAFLVSWLDDGNQLRAYPIHVTVESGRSHDVLLAALKRQITYFQLLNEYLVACGSITEEETFDLGCIGSFFSDRGSVVCALRSKLATETQNTILHMYELQHRTHIIDSEISRVLGPGNQLRKRAFRAPVYQALKTAYLFVSGNDSFAEWIRQTYQAQPTRWVERVTYGRFHTFGAAAWTMLSPVTQGHVPLWDALVRFLDAYPVIWNNEIFEGCQGSRQRSLRSLSEVQPTICAPRCTYCHVRRCQGARCRYSAQTWRRGCCAY